MKPLLSLGCACAMSSGIFYCSFRLRQGAVLEESIIEGLYFSFCAALILLAYTLWPRLLRIYKIIVKGYRL